MGPKDKKFLKGGWGVKPIPKNKQWVLDPIKRAERKAKQLSASELANTIAGFRDAEKNMIRELVQLRRNAMATEHFSIYPGTAPEDDPYIHQAYVDGADYQDQILQTIQIQRKAYERRFAEIAPKP